MSEPKTVEERNTLETRRALIIQYVIDHPNCTKADVIRYMQGRAAVRTTHGLLISLIKEGKINIQKKHIQTHLLTINGDNDFIKVYKQLQELYEFTQELGNSIHPLALGSSSRYYKTKPPLKYDGIDGLENSFRQLFNIMVQTLYRYNHFMSDADWRLISNRISYVFFNLAHHHWDMYTTEEVYNICSGNIKQFFQTLNKNKNKLVKMMERHQIDEINHYTEFGDKLIDLTDKFKRDVIDQIRKEGIRAA